MTRWIRWSYVLPRLVLLVVMLCALELGTGIAIRNAFVSTGQKIVGAQVEVGSSAASVVRSDVSMRDIRIANPRWPLVNLLQADRLELEFDLNALLRRRAVAQHGLLRGLRFGTPRTSSGALPIHFQDEPQPGADRPSLEVAIDAERWFADLGSRFSQNVLADFQSVQLGDELLQRWPQKYDELEHRAEQLKSIGTRLQKDVEHAQTNPLRNVDFLERLPSELRALKESLQLLEKELAVLPDAVAADRDAVHAARMHDEQLLRERLQVDSIDSSVLTTYLLQNQVSTPVADAIRWIRWTRRSVAAYLDEPRPVRQRGVDVLLSGCQRQPSFLVRSLQIQGTARLAGQPVKLSGTLTDLTSEPAIHGQPIRLDLVATGSLPLKLKAVIDRTGDVCRDELLVDCRGILLPQFQLGQPDRLSLSFLPGAASLNVSLLIVGDDLSGDIQLIQESVQVTPTIAGELSVWQFDQALKESLGRMKSIATRITLGGTLQDPDWTVWSNLGPAVGEALDIAVARAAEKAMHDLVAHCDGHIQQRLDSLNQLVALRSAEIRPQLEGPKQQLAKLIESYTGGRGLSQKQLGRRLPAESLFR